MTTFRESLRAYEDWLRSQIPDHVVEDDLKGKRKKIKKNAFTFLRGTCLWWAETARDLCRGLADAPATTSLGDAHIENFGIWRDADMRLVWGANDFDEAARTPYPFDLIRLAASAVLASGESAADVTAPLLEGYRARLDEPRPYILETEFAWLRSQFMATNTMRAAFWAELAALPPKPQPPQGTQAALRAALSTGAASISFAPRVAGVGSRGRARFVARATLFGAPLAREAKALAPSCWTRDKAYAAVDIMRVARGPHRAPDPHLAVRDGLVIRRLGPDSRKLESKDGALQLSSRLLQAMGGEIANIHASVKPQAAKIAAHFDETGARAFTKAVARVAEATEAAWKAFAAV